MSDARKRELEYLNAEATEPARTAEQSSAQTTTDSYADVAESELEVTRAEGANYVIENTGANALDARAVGAIEDDAGNLSAYAPTGDETTSIAAGAAAVLTVDTSTEFYDKLKVQVKASTGGSQGAAKVHGAAVKR